MKKSHQLLRALFLLPCTKKSTKFKLWPEIGGNFFPLHKSVRLPAKINQCCFLIWSYYLNIEKLDCKPSSNTIHAAFPNLKHLKSSFISQFMLYDTEEKGTVHNHKVELQLCSELLIHHRSINCRYLSSFSLFCARFRAPNKICLPSW